MGLFDFFNRKKYRESQPETRSRYIINTGGTLIHADTAMQVSAFYRGVTYISTQLAKLPWEVKDADNKILANDRVTRLLKVAPNNESTSFMFKLFLVQSAIMHGNGYAEIERDTLGRVVALWPIPAKHVDIFRDVNNELIYRIIGGDIQNRGDAFLRQKDIFHLRNFHSKDGIIGLGIIEYAAETLGISLGADKFANALFTNGGMPSGVLSIDGKLSEEALKRVKESWENAHGGRKTGGTAILEEGLSYNPISHDPQVLQFLESREFSVLEIARFLGLPPTKLFDNKAATFNNIENANLEVATDTLDAWARNMESEADVKLLNNGFAGRKTEIDLQAVFRGDMDTRSQYFNRMMQAGAMTPNEIRRLEGKAPYEGGDRYYIATNNFSPSNRIDEIIDAQIGANMPEPEETEVDNTEEESSEEILNQAAIRYLQSKS